MINQISKNNKFKLLYFHIPKTAGSSINEFFKANLDSCDFHIEGVKDFDKEFCNKYDFISGHVSYTRMAEILNLDEWITFATFREPLSYTISHIKWVRKLADKGEEKRFQEHPKIFQKIALKMTEYDFSVPSEITEFIKWLESINFYYFHNTQLHYMHPTNNQHKLSDHQVKIALENMKNINFIGIQENMDEFMETISCEFGWELDKRPRVNVNENNYGFDINDSKTQEALLPLYEKDLILYKEAKKLYNKQKTLYRNKPTEDIIGYVDSISKNKIRGWCRSKNSLQKLELELRLENQIIATTTANKYRLGLKEKGIHFTGRCAFEFDFDLESSIDTDKLQVYIANTNISIDKVYK